MCKFAKTFADCSIAKIYLTYKVDEPNKKKKIIVLKIKRFPKE